MAPSIQAFSSVTADRTSQVSIVDDPNANLGIDNKSNIGELRGDDGYQNVTLLTNNFGLDLTDVTVSIQHIPNADDNNLIAAPTGAFLGAGSSTKGEVKCDPNGPLNSPGVRDVRFRVDGAGDSVSVSNATFTVTIDIRCNKGNSDNVGLRNVFASDLSTNQNNQDQTLEFELTEDLAAGDYVNITLVNVEKGNKVDYSGVTLSTGAAGTLTESRPQGNDYQVEFQADTTLSAGTVVTISVSGVDVNTNKADTFDAQFQRSDKPDAATTQFNTS